MTSLDVLQSFGSDLAFIYRNSGIALAISTADGLLYLATVIPEKPATTELIATP